MPMTLGPIVIAACPGTGSFWLQQMLQEPDGCHLVRGGILKQMTVKKAVAWKWDRHAPGPCTVTIVRSVDELLRSWFVRFRKAPPPPGVIRDNATVLHPGHFHVYLGEINMAIDYWGPDFKTWLDHYLKNTPGAVTCLLERFTSEAKHVLNQENLLEETIVMLRAEGIDFDEAKVRAYTMINRTKVKPPWPDGYAYKLVEAG